MSPLTDFRMPALGADMEKGTLLEWRVKPGDHVERGQIVADVDTAKSAIEIEVFTDGVVDSLLVGPGEEVPVGTVLARLRTGTAAPTAPVVAAPSQTATTTPPASRRVDGRADGRRISPLLRRLAEERHVDLATVTGTGPHGRIVRADIDRGAAPATPPAPSTPPDSVAPPTPTPPRASFVRASPLARRKAAAAGIELAGVAGSGPGGAVTAADLVDSAPATEPAPEQVRRAAGTKPAVRAPSPSMRAAIGALMRRSKREIPHYYLSTTIDLHAALSRLEAYNAGHVAAERLLPVSLLLRAVVQAAVDYPEFNGHYVSGRFRPAAGVRLGMPVSMRTGGLVTPVVDGAERLSLVDLNAAVRDLATRAKAGRLRGSELGEPSLTVTSLGERGVEAVFGVIFPPQVALVGFGAVVPRPWATDGLLGVRPLVTATLSADHRVSDGHRGALFLGAIRDRLHHPSEPDPQEEP